MEYRWIALEPVQILQSLLASPVTLVAGRPFLVRGYVQLKDFSEQFSAALEVTIYDRQDNIVDYCVDNLNAALSRTAVAHLSQSGLNPAEYTQFCRNSLDNSINWLVKPEHFKNGLQELNPGDSYFLKLDAIANVSQNVANGTSSMISNERAKNSPSGTLEDYTYLMNHQREFGRDFGAFYITGDSGLRLNTIGLRYYDPYGEDAYPTVVDHQFDRAWSYLAASFPVGQLEWTSLNVNAPVGFGPPFVSGQRAGTDLQLQNHIDSANAFIAALRANDIGIAHYKRSGKDSKTLDGGVAPDTLYYGMMNSADNAFEGAASDVPEIPTRKTVATGPADNTTGYYCAHEIGHMLGQTHRGGTNQRAEIFSDWLTRPRLASNKRRDDFLLRMDRDGQSMQRLAWSRTYDLMSYGEQTWPSEQTLFELRTQLESLHEQLNEFRHSDNWRIDITGDEVKTDYVFVSGTYDLQSGDGRLLYAIPLRRNQYFESEFLRLRRSEPADQISVRSLSNEEAAAEQRGSHTGIELVLHTGDSAGGRLVIPEQYLNLRRKNLDFPSETGMFQALISLGDLRHVMDRSGQVDNDHSDSCFLTLVQYKRVVGQAASDMEQVFNKTQLHQVALRCVPHNDSVYRRIRPTEINLEQTEDHCGFNLRIDKQLAANELNDSTFIVEVGSVNDVYSSATLTAWRTVALNVRVGEDVFLDARKDGALKLKESVNQQSDRMSDKLFNIPDEELLELLGITADIHDIARPDRIKQILRALESKTDDNLYARWSSVFVARVRISASLGLDRVVVFDGLVEQCAMFNKRTICLSIDREHKTQPFKARDVVRNSDLMEEVVRESDLVEEDVRVNHLLQKSRQIIGTMEIISALGLIPLEEGHVRDLLTVVARLHQCRVDPRTSSSEFTLHSELPSEDEEKEDAENEAGEKGAVEQRTVYYSVR